MSRRYQNRVKPCSGLWGKRTQAKPKRLSRDRPQRHNFGLTLQVPMEALMAVVLRNLRAKARFGFEPIVDVVAGRAVPLAVEMVGILADIAFRGRSDRGSGGGGCFHGCFHFKNRLWEQLCLLISTIHHETVAGCA